MKCPISHGEVVPMLGMESPIIRGQGNDAWDEWSGFGNHDPASGKGRELLTDCLWIWLSRDWRCLSNPVQWKPLYWPRQCFLGSFISVSKDDVMESTRLGDTFLCEFSFLKYMLSSVNFFPSALYQARKTLPVLDPAAWLKNCHLTGDGDHSWRWELWLRMAF